MPWPPDDITNGSSKSQKTAFKGQPSLKMKPKSPLTRGDGVKYIPSQMDPIAGATAAAARQDPIFLMIQDLGVLFRLLRFVPKILSPFSAEDKNDELYLSAANVKVGFLQALLALIQLLFLVMVVPAFVSLPGGVFLAATVLCCLACYILTLPMQGPPILFSKLDDSTKILAERNKNERWVFVNGICTGHSTSQIEIDCLSKTFGRAVIGIHNKSYGIFADLAMCMIQRAVSYHDFGSRMAYTYIKPILIDPTVTKVVLIAHSQGGILISQAIDDLLSELPAQTMSKMEVYTFGSAASHFSNPFRTLKPNSPTMQSAGQRSLEMSRPNAYRADGSQKGHIIAHMEHYANEYDLVPRWGVLHSVQDILKTRYAGSVFVRKGASGHMFNQHYLNPMFLSSTRQTRAPVGKKGRSLRFEEEATGHKENDSTDLSDDHFLDRIVSPDKKLATRRDSTVIEELGIMRRESGLEFGSGQVLKDSCGPNDASQSQHACGDDADECLTFVRTASDRIVAEEASGKTVKDLSRLWRYLGGNSPDDHHDQVSGKKHDDEIPRRGSSNSKRRHGHQHNIHSPQRRSNRESTEGSLPNNNNKGRPESPILKALGSINSAS